MRGDLHNTVLILAHNGTSPMRYVGPVAVIKLHNIVDDLNGIVVSKTIRPLL